MNLNTLQDFRHDVYCCFPRAADALFNTVDALLTETQAHSFPELSLSPLFERRWGSLYEAFEDGRIDQERLRGVFAKYLLQPVTEKQLWLGIDATSIERPESKTSPDRTVVYKPNLPESSKPISYGWQFSTVVILPEQPSSWTIVLDQQRIGSEQTSVEVAATQLRQLAPLLGCRPIVASDRWYSCAPFLLATEGLPFDKLLRLKRPRIAQRAIPSSESVEKYASLKGKNESVPIKEVYDEQYCRCVGENPDLFARGPLNAILVRGGRPHRRLSEEAWSP